MSSKINLEEARKVYEEVKKHINDNDLFWHKDYRVQFNSWHNKNDNAYIESTVAIIETKTSSKYPRSTSKAWNKNEDGQNFTINSLNHMDLIETMIHKSAIADPESPDYNSFKEWKRNL